MTSCRVPLIGVVFVLAVSCARTPPPAPVAGTAISDLDQVQSADVSILFVGNSHTSGHDIPSTVGDMVQFLQPNCTVHTQTLSAAFLENAAQDPTLLAELDTRPWKFVVFQAQKISESGRFVYSTQEGIDLANRAKARGIQVVFYAEWGLLGKPGDGERNAAIYQGMADASGARVAATGRAWDLALAQLPDLTLHDLDGNHQNALGAFLTACVLTGRILEVSPAPLAKFPSHAGTEADRQFLAQIATQSLGQKK